MEIYVAKRSVYFRRTEVNILISEREFDGLLQSDGFGE